MTGRWLPHPVLSLLLAVAWLALQRSLSLPQLITAGVLGIGLPLLLSGFLHARVRLARPGLVPAFAARVLWDIVVANFTVARIVVTPGYTPHPVWVVVPLALREPNAIVLLASVITMTPGTVSCRIDEARRVILVHALDNTDPDGLVAEIKDRYEAPLMAIFGA